MNKEDWQRVRHFSENEGWGDPALMAFDYVHEVDLYRDFIGTPMVLTPHGGTGGVHINEHSLHYCGRAGDWIFVQKQIGELLDLFFDATRFAFTEIGLYPDWTFNGQKLGGIHLGKVATDAATQFVKKKYWIGLKGSIYVAMDTFNLKKYGFV